MRTQNVQTRVWRSANDNHNVAKPCSKPPITEDEFDARVQDSVLDRRIEVVDSYGYPCKLHVYVAAHAGRRLRERGSTSCDFLLIEWLKEALHRRMIIDDVSVADDMDTFVVFDAEFGRYLVFTIRALHDEYQLLLRTVFFAAWNRQSTFFAEPKSKVYGIYEAGIVKTGSEVLEVSVREAE